MNLYKYFENFIVGYTLIYIDNLHIVVRFHIAVVLHQIMIDKYWLLS